MARKSSISDQKVFTAVGLELVASGKITLDGIKTQTGLSTGSLYHRYQSRENLMARAWLYALQAFHAAYLAGFDEDGAFPGASVIRRMLNFCRQQPALATILVYGSRRQFIQKGVDADMIEQIDASNARVKERLMAFAREHRIPILACKLALVNFPLAAVKDNLPNHPIPASLENPSVSGCASLVEDYAISSRKPLPVPILDGMSGLLVFACMPV